MVCNLRFTTQKIVKENSAGFKEILECLQSFQTKWYSLTINQSKRSFKY